MYAAHAGVPYIYTILKIYTINNGHRLKIQCIIFTFFQQINIIAVWSYGSLYYIIAYLVLSLNGYKLYKYMCAM